MKTFLTSLITALVTALLVVQFSGKGGSSESNGNRAYERVMKTRVLRCGYATWPPYTFLKDPNNGEVTGFIPDYLAVLAKNLNVKIEYVEETGYGAQAIEGLKANRFDVFCGGMNQNAQRGQHILFSRPFFYNPIYAYVRVNDHRFDKGLDMVNDAKYTLSVMDGEATDTVAKNLFPQAKTFSLPQNSEMAMLYTNVVQNKADIVMSDVSRANAFLKANPGQLRRANDQPALTYTISLSYSNDEPKLKAMLDAAMLELDAANMTKKLMQKYDPKLEENELNGFYYGR